MTLSDLRWLNHYFKWKLDKAASPPKHIHVCAVTSTGNKRFFKILFSVLQTVFLYTNIIFKQALWKEKNKGLQFFHNPGSSILVWVQEKDYMLLYFFKANMHFKNEVVRIPKLLFTTQNWLGKGASKNL